MNKRQFVIIVFRLFALYLLYNLFSDLGIFLSILRKSWSADENITAFFTVAFAIVIMLFVISLLWRKSEWLMVRIFAIPALSDDAVVGENMTVTDGVEGISEDMPDVSEFQDYYETPFSKESIELVAYSVIGLWTVFTYLTTFLRFLFSNSFFTPSIGIPIIAASAVPLVLGVWLFLRPWQFQGWVEKFKPKPESEDIEK